MSAVNSPYSAAHHRPARAGFWSDKARVRKVLMFGGVGIFLAAAAFFYLYTGRFISSDDAYVHGNKLMVSTDVSGLVKSVNVREGQYVQAGQVLFTLDPKPFQIVLENAQAALASTVQEVESTRAAYRGALAQVGAQAAQVRVNSQTFGRYQSLARQNAIAAMQVDQARASLLSAQATQASLAQNAATQLAKLNGNPNIPAAQTPAYQKAKAAVEEAQRQLDHAVVRAPFAGTIAEVDSLQPGTLVISAMSAFTTTSAVGLVGNKMWISADLKETELTHVRTGQPVDITVDTYPGCDWKGHIETVSAGSDTSFSALPAENASGNWVKVVQRIPVRVAIDRAECDRPLRVGMSTAIAIDTGHRRWYRLMHGL